MKNNEILQFSLLESYADFLRNPRNVGRFGVYVWGFRFVDSRTAETSKFIPYYVGKSRSNIHKRIQEHVHDIRYGTHKIFRTELLSQPENYTSNNQDNFAFVNVTNTKRKKTDLSSEDLVQLTPHLNAYMDNLFITYVSINHLSLDQDQADIYVDRLERYVQEKIGFNRIIARKGDTYPDDFCPELHINVDLMGLFE